MLSRVPLLLRKLSGWLHFRMFTLNKLQAAARRSQERKYAGDWVFQVVPGDGRSFDYGVDYTECAILKFLEAQDAIELLPYLCNIDYLVSKAMGTGLRRTKTLAWGCEMCDFRFKKGREVQQPWPPAFVEKQCRETSAQ